MAKSKVEKVKLGKKGNFSVRKGALHKALGISEDKPIPKSRLDSALNSDNPKTRRMAASAKGLEAMGI